MKVMKPFKNRVARSALEPVEELSDSIRVVRTRTGRMLIEKVTDDVNEVALHVKLASDSVVPKTMGVFFNDTTNNASIIMEKLDTNLQNLLTTYGDKLQPYHYVQIFDGIMRGLKCLHRHEIIHGDLKPENVYVNYSFVGRRQVLKLTRIVIGNFGGSSRGLTSDKTTGTGQYMAPELDSRRVYSNAVDLYALGMMLHKDLKLLSKSLTMMPTLSKWLRRIKRSLKHDDPEKRMTIFEMTESLEFQQLIRSFTKTF